MTQHTDHLKGLLIGASGVLILSPDALLIRLLAIDSATLMFWRGVGLFVVIGAIVVARHGRRSTGIVTSMGWPGAILACSYAATCGLFVIGINNTGTANVLVILASSPLFAALFGWFLIRERIERMTLVAILIGMAGVVIAASDRVGPTNLTGNVAAIGCAILLGLNFSLLRLSRGRDMTPAFALGGAILAAVSLSFAAPTSVPLDKLVYLIILCGFVQPISFVLIMQAPRYLPAAEANLLMLLESVLGPLWVWIMLSENPTSAAVSGGGIILMTIAAHSLVRLRRSKPVLSYSQSL